MYLLDMYVYSVTLPSNYWYNLILTSQNKDRNSATEDNITMLFSRSLLRPITNGTSISKSIRRWQSQSTIAANLAGLNGRHFLSIDELRYVPIMNEYSHEFTKHYI
jgi:hypothetical protein